MAESQSDTDYACDPRIRPDLGRTLQEVDEAEAGLVNCRSEVRRRLRGRIKPSN
jgi:hypothetical protein